VRAELRDALSALADGEVADPQLVAEALLEPEAAALIVTVAETRARLRDSTSEPGPAFSARVERAMAAESRRAIVLVRRAAPVLYAGLGLTAGILVGVLIGPGGASQLPMVIGPPPAPVAAIAAPPPMPSPPPAGPRSGTPQAGPPAARSVYRFEPGRNWREGS
jgi:hypothetical protein